MIDNLGNLERTHSCGALRKEHSGARVTLMGWCARRRDFGPLTFIDLRDREGITQVVVNQENAQEAHAKAKEVRGEYILAVTGDVVLRDEGARNPKHATGDVEVQASDLVILNDARTLPFQLDAPASEALASEDLRLKYRYLDLRQTEFSQIDVELSFATPDQIYELVEGLFARVFRLIGVELQTPFPRFTFAEVMQRFGSDKPDLRIEGMELKDLSPALTETTFAPFASALGGGGQVKGIAVRGGATMSRKTLDELQEFAKRYGAGPLAWS